MLDSKGVARCQKFRGGAASSMETFSPTSPLSFIKLFAVNEHHDEVDGVRDGYFRCLFAGKAT